MTGDGAIRSAVAAGLGVSILPQYAMQGHGEPDNLVMLDVEKLPLRVSWHMVRPVGRDLSPVAEEFVEFASREAGNVARELMRLGAVRAAAEDLGNCRRQAVDADGTGMDKGRARPAVAPRRAVLGLRLGRSRLYSPEKSIDERHCE